MLGFEAQIRAHQQMGLTKKSVLKARSSHTERSETEQIYDLLDVITLSARPCSKDPHPHTFLLSLHNGGCRSLKGPETKSNIQVFQKGK